MAKIPLNDYFGVPLHDLLVGGTMTVLVFFGTWFRWFGATIAWGALGPQLIDQISGRQGVPLVMISHHSCTEKSFEIRTVRNGFIL